MTSKADALADRFEQASQDFIKDVEALSDREWREKTDSEGWTVAATAHHAAISSGPIAAMAQAAATGGAMPPITSDMLHEMNAKHAQEFATCTREETRAAMRESAAGASKVVRGLKDDQLGRSAMLPLGMELTAEQIIEMVLIGHIVGHGQSIKAAVAAR